LMEMRTPQRIDVPVESVSVSAYTVPTDAPESDGTLEWDSTTIVVVEVVGGGRDAMDVRGAWLAMGRALRNAGRPGIGSMAIAAVDIALWDLKGRVLDVPLVRLLGSAHEEVPVYGSGGFTSYSLERIREQLGGWVEEGIPRVKMKTGRDPARDPVRLDAARRAIGDGAELYVDANGALTRKQALAWADRLAQEWNVSWFEEPVSSADLEGLRLLRD